MLMRLLSSYFHQILLFLRLIFRVQAYLMEIMSALVGMRYVSINYTSWFQLIEGLNHLGFS